MEMWLPILVALITGLVSYVAAERRIRTEVQQSETRLRRDYQLQFAAESVVRRLLQVEQWRLRSFGEIKRRLESLDDSEVRKTLIRAGAVCFRDGNDQEMWGLIERNEDRLAKELV